MNKKRLELKDSFGLKLTRKETKELKDSYESGKALVVKVKATHGGYINGNKFCYSIDSMKSAAKSWIKPFNKPVLAHHNDISDPIGRVIDSEFVPIDTDRKAKPKGYILLTLRITDDNAIDKILDNRYMTVSVGSLPNNAFCSICDRNLIEDGFCDHKRGQKYENKLCYWLVDVASYTEVSFVNKPADEYQFGIENAQLVERDASDEEDFEDENLTDIKSSIKFYFEDEENLSKENNLDENLNLNEENVDSTWDKNDLSMIQWLIDELEKDEDLEDGKLSTAARKKLSGNVFCGPNRSFPVNDCAHYSAAKKLLGRYKGPGDKSRILTCIERRGKSLGCPGAKKDNKDNITNGVIMEDKTLDQLKAEIKEWQDKYNELNKVHETLKTEKTQLEQNLNDKSTEITKLEEKIDTFEAKEHQNLTDKVYELRVKLGKNDVKDLKDEEVVVYKENIAKRTTESLLDSVTDLSAEMKTVEKPNEPEEKVTKDSKDKKNESNTTIKEKTSEEAKITRDLSDAIKK